MCVVSMIVDHFNDRWNNPPFIQSPYNPLNPGYIPPLPQPLTPGEIDHLRKLMERAKKYDQDNNEPDCELESKKQQLRDLAKKLGVELNI